MTVNAGSSIDFAIRDLLEHLRQADLINDAAYVWIIQLIETGS